MEPQTLGRGSRIQQTSALRSRASGEMLVWGTHAPLGDEYILGIQCSGDRQVMALCSVPGSC